MKVRDAILRPLEDEPDPVVRVDAVARLPTDIKEYVLTDRLAEEFCRILERVVNSARPGGNSTSRVGAWISGFFGSGKSHFAKLAGHLLADTEVGGESARSLFANLLQSSRPNDDRLAGLLQQAKTYDLQCHLTAFDITTLHSPGAEGNVALIFLRAFHKSLDLSQVVAFANLELELKAEDQYDAFCAEYQKTTGKAWADDRNLASSLAQVARCLPKFLPKRHPTMEDARANLQAAIADAEKSLDIDRVIGSLLRWLDSQESNRRLVFVADEVGAWAGSDLKRIEQLRAFVETIGERGEGRIWLLVTSQEKLSDVVKNTTDDREFLQRLEARFQTNVHLESSEVGTVIETRILKKKPAGDKALGEIWERYQQMLRDVGESPGLELGANYPKADKDAFVRDYPFLPYQVPASADLFGGMRGVKVSSGARSMIKVAFDALRNLADRDLGALVSWDQIFDSANSDNEFADEQYLGSQGLNYIESADTHVTGIAFEEPSRVLKALWLVQQSPRIPRTEGNIARLLATSVDDDVLLLEQHVQEALKALEGRNFVRREVTTDQWKFLTQDEVTVEKIVKRLAEDFPASRIRKEVMGLCSTRLNGMLNGRVTHGVSNTVFEHGLSFSGSNLKSPSAEVQLNVVLEDSPAARSALLDVAATLESKEITWILAQMPKMEERLRRALAIDALPDDDEFRRIATERTRAEADKLAGEAAELRRETDSDIAAIFQGGKVIYAGRSMDLDPQTNEAKARIEVALRDRIDATYPRFKEGDRQFKAANIEKLFTAPPGERMALDPGLGLFSIDGHVNNNVLVEELTKFLKGSMKNAGADAAAWFARPPFGWQEDLIRYAAAAMFVDGRISVTDKNGKAFDDPRSPQARALFGHLAFRSTRLLVEEDALTPDEVASARSLLSEMGRPPQDGQEITLKDTTLQLCSDLTRRGTLVDKAANFSFPLPSVFEGLNALLDEIQGAGSRVKVVRALLARADDIKGATTALKSLEEFDTSHGFEQFKRSRDLLAASIDAGLKDDETFGERVAEAEEQTSVLINERRVLDEWAGSYQKYRLEVLEAFRETYAPLRKELAERSEMARQEVRSMPEFEALKLTDRTTIRSEFLGEGRTLQEVDLPELKDAQQLLQASAQFSVPHMRLLLSNLGAEQGRAKARVLDLHSKMLEEQGEKAKRATWSPAEAFAGKRFESADQVGTAFDEEKERVKKLFADGAESVEVV